ncbi:MAG: hypothetical protein AB7T27_04090 [Kiritimatiellia bacterium]
MASQTLSEKYDRDGLIRHSLIVMIFTHAGSAANMIFHMVMGRELPKAEYGIMSSMLGLGLILATPMMALATTLAHYTAQLREQGNTGAARQLMRYWLKRLAPFSLAFLALGLFFSGPIADFFNLQSRMPVMITALIFSVLIPSPVFPGILQGLQSFVWMSLAYNAWGVIRLLLGTALVLMFGGLAVYPLAAQFIGYALGLVFGWLVIRRELCHEPETPVAIHGTDSYFLRSLIVLTGFAFLMNADIVMVKHYFAPEEAGLFAQVATIGRIMVFLVQPIAGAMFPKVISGGEISRGHAVTLLRAIVFSVLITLAAVAACLLLPWLPLRIIFGIAAPSAEQILLLRVVVCAMAPLGITFLLLNYELAQRRFGPAWPLVACAALYAAGVARWHGNVLHVAFVLGAVSLLSLAAITTGIGMQTLRAARREAPRA